MTLVSRFSLKVTDFEVRRWKVNVTEVTYTYDIVSVIVLTSDFSSLNFFIMTLVSTKIYKLYWLLPCKDKSQNSLICTTRSLFAFFWLDI